MKNSPGLPIRVSPNQDAGATADTHAHAHTHAQTQTTTRHSANVVFSRTQTGQAEPTASPPAGQTAGVCAGRALRPYSPDRGGFGRPERLKTDGLQPFHLFTLMVCDLTFTVRDRESSWLELVRPPAGRTLPLRPPLSSSCCQEAQGMKQEVAAVAGAQTTNHLKSTQRNCFWTPERPLLKPNFSLVTMIMLCSAATCWGMFCSFSLKGREEDAWPTPIKS